MMLYVVSLWLSFRAYYFMFMHPEHGGSTFLQTLVYTYLCHTTSLISHKTVFFYLQPPRSLRMPHSFDFYIKPRQVLLFIRRRSKNIFISNLWSQPLYSRISTRLHFWKQDSSSRFCHMIFILPSFPLFFLSLPRPSALFVVLLRWSGRRFRASCCCLSPLQFSLRFAWTLSHTDNRPDLWTDDRRGETDRWSICCCQLDNIIPLLLISTNLTMPLFSSSFCSHVPSPITDDPPRAMSCRSRVFRGRVIYRQTVLFAFPSQSIWTNKRTSRILYKSKILHHSNMAKLPTFLTYFIP